MMEEIRVLRSYEINDALWEQIAFGYQVCFNLKKTIEEFKHFFSSTVTGYTLHSLKFSEKGELIGHNYFQPFPYNFKGKKIILGLSGGTYVLPEFRKDIFIFHDLTQALFKEAKNLGWDAILGVPNENSFEYLKKIIKYKYLGDLDYYILPVNLSKILHSPKFSFLNYFSRPASFLFSKLSYGISSLMNNKENMKSLRIDRCEEFLKARFSDSGYKMVHRGGIRCYYKMYDEDGINTAYVLDFFENGVKTSKALSLLINYILKNEKADAILYVGSMNLRQCSLIKVPKKFIPHDLHFTVKMLNKDNPDLENTLSNIKNIDFSLLNFDTR